MKKKIIIFLFLLICGCGKNLNYKQPEEIYFNLQATLPVHSEVYLNGLIIETNADIKSENYRLDTSQTGKYKDKIEYEYNDQKYIHEYEVEIVDTEVPFIFGGTNLTLLKDNQDNLCEIIAYGDNYDSKPKCEIIGEYEPSKIGNYELKIIVRDASNNQAQKNVKVKIVEKKESSSSTDQRLAFDVVKNKYQGSNIEYGIDVSSWQEKVDFKEVIKAGITFVMIRIGFERGDGTMKIDSYFKENISNAKQAGLKVGIYFYSNAKDVSDIIKQVSWILDELDGVALDLPIAFDWEDWENFNKYNLSFYELNNLAHTFIDHINAYGEYQGCLYSSKYYLENIWREAKVYPVWLAHYTEQTTYQGEYFMWQLANTGRVPGISGPVDLNILYHNNY